MAFEELIAKTDEGRLIMRGNELLIYDDTATGDPVALRFRSMNETKGKHSIDKYIQGAWRELGFIGYKEDERGRTDPAHRNCLEIEFWGHKPGDSFEDADYERVFAIRHDGPVFYKGTGAPPTGLPSAFQSDDGLFLYNVQGDSTEEFPFGRIVQYRRDPNGVLTPVAILRPEPI